MQQGDGQQIPTPQAAHQATHDVSSQQEGDQEYSRKRKHEASDPLVGWDLGLQDPIMNPSEAGLWQRQKYQPMFSLWQSGMMGMPRMEVYLLVRVKQAVEVSLFVTPPPDPKARSPMEAMKQVYMGHTMPPPPPPKQPGVIHTRSYYRPQNQAMHGFYSSKKRSAQKKLPKGVHSSDEAYAKALSILRKRADETPPLPSAPTDIKLIEDSDSNLLTDYFSFIILLLAVCRLTEKDRKTRGGKRQDVVALKTVIVIF
jgi:hypothetical protein